MQNLFPIYFVTHSCNQKIRGAYLDVLLDMFNAKVDIEMQSFMIDFAEGGFSYEHLDGSVAKNEVKADNK